MCAGRRAGPRGLTRRSPSFDSSRIIRNAKNESKLQVPLMSRVRMTFNCCLQWLYYFIQANYPVKRSASASFRRNGEEMGLPCGRHSTGTDGSFDWAANGGRTEAEGDVSGPGPGRWSEPRKRSKRKTDFLKAPFQRDVPPSLAASASYGAGLHWFQREAPSHTEAFVSQRDVLVLASEDNAFPAQSADANCFNRA